MVHFFESIRQFFSDMFVSASNQENEINRLFINFSILSAFILGIVIFLVVGGVFFFRAGKRKGEPKQIHGNRALEIAWTVIPFIIVTVLFFMSLKVMENINQPDVKRQQPDIVIIAHQWWWDMRYPDKGVITANELHIPVGKKLLMRIESADVIHSWWVPALGRKTDAIPGRPNFAWIEADSIGEYEGKCSEYCGTEHAWMLIKVVAQSQDDFNQWITHQQQPAVIPTDSTAIKGERLFQTMTCGSCHAISGTPANAHLAPDLSHLASRETILSGMLVNNRENLAKWIRNPQKVKIGSHMPNFLLTEKEVDELMDYLDQLK